MLGIVAVSQNKIIGNQGVLPWYLPKDLKFFKQMTEGKEVIMGSNTFASLKKPLNNRISIIVTRKNDGLLRLNGTSLDFNSLEVVSGYAKYDDTTYLRLANSRLDVLNNLVSPDTAFVVGGSEIYELFSNDVTQWLVTLVEKDYEGDTFFDYQDLQQKFHVVQIMNPESTDIPYKTYSLVRKDILYGNGDDLTKFLELDAMLFER